MTSLSTDNSCLDTPILGSPFAAMRLASAAYLDSGSLKEPLPLGGRAPDPGSRSMLHIWAASTMHLNTVLLDVSGGIRLLPQDLRPYFVPSLYLL